ncbi:phage baseplate assembly protein V [Marinobacter sp. X15-166B]|uniref:phage baseplate assembly protein V n=1 Tax=Marinobacter sp. X15-166B TaxID=1897620 RepID=UPI00085C5A7F|nr:phage baseplate assembly protein V [Marinobacter sp. X15-166B]OEY67461.1 hypothetical protein BG841_14145 [Marinobacter sp. X15-166B]
MNTLSEAFRSLNNLIRIGTIAEVDTVRARARVQAGDNLTGWQPWISPRAGTTVEWSPPTVGEQVILFSPAGDLAQAVILTGLFTQNAPSESEDEHKRVYPDGTEIAYDHVKKELVASFVDKVNINITGDATINVGGDAVTAVAGTCKVNATKIHHNDGMGVVTMAHICHFTGTPHSDGSATVTAGK